MPSTSSVLVRNLIYGVEDSLVSTVGLLAGLATQGISKETILLTGFTYICVEGFSMAVGSFLSEESTQIFETKGEVSAKLPLFAGLVCFVTFLVTGLIPVLPYLLWTGNEALVVSVAISLVILGIVGAVHAKFSKVSIVPRIIKMVLIGGIAIVLGVLVANLVGAA